jgi:hypothetical protein
MQRQASAMAPMGMLLAAVAGVVLGEVPLPNQRQLDFMELESACYQPASPAHVVGLPRILCLPASHPGAAAIQPA